MTKTLDVFTGWNVVRARRAHMQKRDIVVVNNLTSTIQGHQTAESTLS